VSLNHKWPARILWILAAVTMFFFLIYGARPADAQEPAFVSPAAWVHDEDDNVFTANVTREERIDDLYGLALFASIGSRSMLDVGPDGVAFVELEGDTWVRLPIVAGLGVNLGASELVGGSGEMITRQFIEFDVDGEWGPFVVKSRTRGFWTSNADDMLVEAFSVGDSRFGGRTRSSAVLWNRGLLYFEYDESRLKVFLGGNRDDGGDNRAFVGLSFTKADGYTLDQNDGDRDVYFQIEVAMLPGGE